MISDKIFCATLTCALTVSADMWLRPKCGINMGITRLNVRGLLTWSRRVFLFSVMTNEADVSARLFLLPPLVWRSPLPSTLFFYYSDAFGACYMLQRKPLVTTVLVISNEWLFRVGCDSGSNVYRSSVGEWFKWNGRLQFRLLMT